MAVMNRMRQNTKVILMILVVAFMLTIIIDWGMGGFKGNKPQGVIASIEDQDLSYEQFREMYQNEIAAYREQRGSEPEGRELQMIENKVFENIVQQMLLSNVVKEMNLDVTNDEIKDEIFNNPPAFLRNEQVFKDSSGIFDMKKYQAALDNPQAGQFWLGVEQYLRSSIPMQKLGNLINSTALVTDDEAKLEFIRSNVKAKIDYIYYTSAKFGASAPEPTDEEISAYYKDNKDEFNEVEKRNLDYVFFELKATKADTQAIFNQANDLLDDVKSGKSFAELASIYSEDAGSAEKGGDLGYFGKGAMVKPFEEAAFAAKKGDIVGPIQSQFGLHIIKVEDKKKEKGEWKVKASHILLKFDVSPSTRDALREEAEYIAEYAKESDLKTVTTAEGVELLQTQPFVEGNFIPGLGMETKISRFAFKSKLNTVSDVIQTSRGFVVASVTEIIPEHIKSLEEAKPVIISKLNTEKRLEQARIKCQAAYDKLVAGTLFDDVAAEDSLSIKQTDEFDLSGYIPGIGREANLIGTVTKLNVGEYAPPIKAAQGYYLIQLTDKSNFNEEEFARQKESIKKQLVQSKQQAIFRNWYTSLRESADIKDYRRDYL